MPFKTHTRFGALLLAATAVVLNVSAVSAQTSIAQLDLSRLTALYAAQERSPKNTWTVRQIAAERDRLRSQIDDQLNQFVGSVGGSAGDAPQVSTDALDAQRRLVAALDAKRQETQVDGDLLARESVLYQPGAATGSQLDSEPRLTGSLAEFRAKTAAIEERKASLDFFLSMQRDRLSQLSRQQLFGRFSSFILAGQYLLLIVLVIALERLARARFFSRIQNRERRYRMTKVFTAAVYVVLVLWLLTVVSTRFPGILTSFAIVGAGVAVALQDVLKDVVGWLVILQRRTFTLGQRVTIGTITGDVIDISLLRTTLMQVSPAAGTNDDINRSGKVVSVPNALALREAIVNYNATSDFLESQISLTITEQSDWRTAKQILEQILAQHTDAFAKHAQTQYAHRTQNFYSPPEPFGSRVFTEVTERGIAFTIRFTAPIGQRRAVSSAITEEILSRFASHNPAIAFRFI